MTLEAPDRIYAQYRNSPKALDWYAVTRALANQIQTAADDIASSYDIDNNLGVQLDVIGRIVGTDRSSITDVQSTVVEFGDDGQEFGDIETQFSAGFISLDTQLSDSYFRSVIKTKVQQNNNDTTIDGIIRAVESIFENDVTATIIDNEDMTFDIQISGVISDIEIYLILNKDLIPKPQGVRINGYLLTSPQMSCGDDVSCGDLGAECLGAIGT